MHHLSPPEFIDALDGALPAVRREHMERCPACLAQVQALRATAAAAAPAGDVPEPSPLFWDHFQARVRTAVDREPVPPARPWWLAWRSLVIAGGTTLAVAALLFHLSASPVPAPAPGVTAASPAVPAALDDPSWRFVAEVASTLPYDDLQAVVAPAPGAADAMVGVLTSAERAALARLVEAEERRLQ